MTCWYIYIWNFIFVLPFSCWKRRSLYLWRFSTEVPHFIKQQNKKKTLKLPTRVYRQRHWEKGSTAVGSGSKEAHRYYNRHVTLMYHPLLLYHIRHITLLTSRLLLKMVHILSIDLVNIMFLFRLLYISFRPLSKDFPSFLLYQY